MENRYETLCAEARGLFAQRAASLAFNTSSAPASVGWPSHPHSVPAWDNISSPSNFSLLSEEQSATDFYQRHCIQNGNTANNAVRIGLQVSCLILIFLSSFISNSMVFMVFFRKPSLLTTSNRFVLNLAVCNFLMTIVVMPFVIASSITVDWSLGQVWCQITGVVTTLLFVTCIFTLLLIAIDRYYAIMKPLHYDLHMTCRKTWAFIVALWVASLAVAIPPVFGWNSIVYQMDKGLCTVLWRSSHYSDRLYSFFVVLTCFVIPYMVMLWIYVTVFREAQKTTALARRNSVTVGEGGEGGLSGLIHQPLPATRRRSSSTSLIHAVYRRHSSGTTRSLLSALHKDDYKAAKTSLLVMSTFTLCWLPFFILIVLEASLGQSGAWWLETASIWVALTGCALNPLVYVFRSTSIKQELRTMLCGRDFSTRIERVSTTTSIRETLRERKMSLANSSDISRRDSVVVTNGCTKPVAAPATFRISPSSSSSSIPTEVKDVTISLAPARPVSTVTFAGVKTIKDAVHL